MQQEDSSSIDDSINENDEDTNQARHPPAQDTAGSPTDTSPSQLGLLYETQPKPSQNQPKKNKVATIDPIEHEKLEILKQITTAIQRPADSEDTFGKQVAEEIRLIQNPLIKTRLKRKLMNDIYEAQECDQALPSSSLPPLMYPPTPNTPHEQQPMPQTSPYLPQPPYSTTSMYHSQSHHSGCM